MDLERLPAALAAAGERLEALEDDLPPRAAAVVLSHTRPPRKTGALAGTGRVVGPSVTFGGGRVDYVRPVLAANNFLTRAEAAAEAELLELTTTAVETATRL